MTAFTPGPWTVANEVGSDNFAHSIYAEGWKGLLIARCDQNDSHNDAALIAAAPAMRDALDSAPVMSKYHGHSGFDAERFIADYEAWRVTARAALRLAGEAVG